MKSNNNPDTPNKNRVNPIQWFPGHMAKTRRIITECLPLVDIVFELLDARAVISSQNPELRKIIGNKPLLTLLNKSDLADSKVNSKWTDYYKNANDNILLIDCKNGTGINQRNPAAKNSLSEKVEKYKNKGMEGRRLRAMIVGIPNVGKSSLLNKLCKNYKAKVEDRPGVTLRKQWVSTDIGLDLLDMPGVLWAKFESEIVGLHLAFIGSIKDVILDSVENAVKLCGVLRNNYPELLAARYKLDIDDVKSDGETVSDYDIFQKIGKNRGYIISADEIDDERCASAILTEFRAAKIGRISLEEPEIII
jgi:ribosome biogenesis GTPase A